MVIRLSLGDFIRSLETAKVARSEERSCELGGFSEIPKTEVCSRAESLTRTSLVISAFEADLSAIRCAVESSSTLTGIKGYYNGERVLVISLPVRTVRTFRMGSGEFLKVLPSNNEIFAALKKAAENAETSCGDISCSQLEINHYQLSY